MIGQTVGHYQILEKLGEGGMGVVYKARDTKLKRVVALKLLPREALADTNAKTRLLREAQSAAALDHPNICTVHEINEADGHTFIVMAYVEGTNLKDRIAQRPLPIPDALDIAIQTAAGLAHAHAAAITHRDIKPANLMVTRDQTVKILDFGLAHAEDHTRLTQTGSTMGTAPYMSPEQARGDKADARADVWSLGAVLYEMITGQRPFKGDHRHALMYAIINEEPEPVTALRTGVPMELERIVTKALSKRPGDRYQHVDEMRVDLNSLARIQQATGSAPVASPRGRSRGGVSGRQRVLIGAALVVVAAVAVIALGLRGEGPVEGAGPEAPQAIQSLAVLPLANLMNDPEQDYFVDGMQEALITELSKLTSLRIISRTSTMRYRGADKAVPEIVAELDVDAVIEGSVLRVDDNVRITAQLIDGRTDEHVWADNYDRELRNILTLLNEVAWAIASEVRTELVPPGSPVSSRPVDPGAYEELLRGTHLFDIGKPAAALQHFRRAVEIDSLFAEGHASVAAAHILSAVIGVEESDVIPKARVAARRALELDVSSSRAHTALGYVQLYFDRDWEAAGESFRTALRIDPNNGYAHHGYADYLLVIGRAEESADQVLRGRRSDPFSPIMNMVAMGHLYLAGRYEECIAEARGHMASDPDYRGARAFLRRALWKLGRHDESVAVLIDSPFGQRTRVREALDRGSARAGPRGAMLALAELLATGEEWDEPFMIAQLYAQAGAVEPALDWLEKSCEAELSTFIHMLRDPLLETVRDDPRFQELSRRMGLPE